MDDGDYPAGVFRVVGLLQKQEPLAAQCVSTEFFASTKTLKQASHFV